MSIRTTDGTRCKFWRVTHASQVQKDLIICELECEDDKSEPVEC